MRPIRIAIVAAWHPDKADGVNQAVVWTSRALVELGCEVEIWDAWSDYQSIGFRDVEPGIRVWELPTAIKGFAIPADTRAFVKKESGRLDFVHFHSCFLPANCTLATYLRCPYAVTPHGGYSRVRMRLRGAIRKWIFFALLSRRYLEQAAFVHVLSESERGAVMELCRQQKFVVATSGCVGFSNEALPWREVGAGRHLLFIGRLDVHCKGLDRMITAFAATSGPDDHITLAGPDFRGGRGQLELMVEKLNISQRVTIRDGVYGEEKKKLIAMCDVFAQLSRWEGVPLTPIEAMGAGRPVLITPETNLADHVAAADAGWIAESEECSKGMDECLRASITVLQHKGMNARHLVESQFQWKTTAQRLLDAYRAARR